MKKSLSLIALAGLSFALPFMASAHNASSPVALQLQKELNAIVHFPDFISSTEISAKALVEVAADGSVKVIQINCCDPKLAAQVTDQIQKISLANPAGKTEQILLTINFKTI